MNLFVDTSAIYALMDEDDANHQRAAGWFSGDGSDPSTVLTTHGYVVVESAALVHRRLGRPAARVLFERLLPALSVRCVEQSLHERAAAGFLAAVRRSPSFVDWVSFQMMRDEGIERAFAFDRDFLGEGFRTVP